MIVTSIDLYSSKGDLTAHLQFRDPAMENPYVVTSITGLDAEEISSRYYGNAATGGAKQYSLSLERREIVMRVSLNPFFIDTETISDLRDDLYRIISASRTGLIEIKFYNGETQQATISGFVTKFESPQFTRTPEVQLTIMCDSPMLKAPTAISSTPSLGGGRTFTLTDSVSTAPHGMALEIEFTDDYTGNFILQDKFSSPNWKFTIQPPFADDPEDPSTWLTDDVLYISSEEGNRYLYYVRSSTTKHLADRILTGSVWPIMFPGENDFYLTPHPISGTDLVVNDTSYTPTFWGI